MNNNNKDSIKSLIFENNFKKMLNYEKKHL